MNIKTNTCILLLQTCLHYAFGVVNYTFDQHTMQLRINIVYYE
jgi:hypothetical protein